jgi:hypothetical protein
MKLDKFRALEEENIISGKFLSRPEHLEEVLGLFPDGLLLL